MNDKQAVRIEIDYDGENNPKAMARLTISDAAHMRVIVVYADGSEKELLNGPAFDPVKWQQRREQEGACA